MDMKVGFVLLALVGAVVVGAGKHGKDAKSNACLGQKIRQSSILTRDTGGRKCANCCGKLNKPGVHESDRFRRACVCSVEPKDLCDPELGSQTKECTKCCQDNFQTKAEALPYSNSCHCLGITHQTYTSGACLAEEANSDKCTNCCKTKFKFPLSAFADSEGKCVCAPNRASLDEVNVAKLCLHGYSDSERCERCCHNHYRTSRLGSVGATLECKCQGIQYFDLAI